MKRERKGDVRGTGREEGEKKKRRGKVRGREMKMEMGGRPNNNKA